MDIGKSVERALLDKRMQKQELAHILEVSPNTISTVCSQKTCSGKMLHNLCTAFQMKASDFVALGE